jgi:tripartite-type tricarboxylate transporter receptor subunit TctC
MLFVQATLKAAWDWAAEKFWPMVEATPRLSPDRGGTIKAMALPDVQEACARQGLDIETSTPQELAARIKRESAMWAGVIRDAGIDRVD